MRRGEHVPAGRPQEKAPDGLPRESFLGLVRITSMSPGLRGGRGGRAGECSSNLVKQFDVVKAIDYLKNGASDVQLCPVEVRKFPTRKRYAVHLA